MSILSPMNQGASSSYLKIMRKYWAGIKASIQIVLEYRGDLFIYTLSDSIAPLMGLLIWFTLSQSGASLIYSQSHLVTYFLLAIFVNVLTNVWGSWFLAEHINTGDFAKYLTRPYSVVMDFAVNNISEKIYKIIAISVVVLVIGAFLFKDSGLVLTINPLSLLLFIPSVIMATLIAFYFDLSIGLTAFWFHDISFLNSSYFLANQFFSGKIIPIVFLPAFLGIWVTFLPFRYTLSFPVEVLLNQISIQAQITGFAVQVGWLLGSFALYKILYAKGVKVFAGYGS